MEKLIKNLIKLDKSLNESEIFYKTNSVENLKLYKEKKFKKKIKLKILKVKLVENKKKEGEELEQAYNWKPGKK